MIRSPELESFMSFDKACGCYTLEEASSSEKPRIVLVFFGGNIAKANGIYDMWLHIFKPIVAGRCSFKLYIPVRGALSTQTLMRRLLTNVESEYERQCAAIAASVRASSPQHVLIWGHSLGGFLAARTAVHLRGAKMSNLSTLVLSLNNTFGSFTEVGQLMMKKLARCDLGFHTAAAVKQLAKDWDMDAIDSTKKLRVFYTCSSPDPVVGCPSPALAGVMSDLRRRSPEDFRQVTRDSDFPYTYGHNDVDFDLAVDAVTAWVLPRVSIGKGA
jgi:hypothetical protein